MARKDHPDRATSGFGIITPTIGSSTKRDWIGNQLKKVYDEALHEKIPDDMMDLLSALDEQDTERPSVDEETAK